MKNIKNHGLIFFSRISLTIVAIIGSTAKKRVIIWPGAVPEKFRRLLSGCRLKIILTFHAESA